MLEALVDGIWTARVPLTAAGFNLGTRMTVVRLEDGGLVLISPVRLTPELQAAVSDLGPVGHLVSPNIMHHLFIGDWKAAFPEATLWADPALAKKRKDLVIDGVLTDEAPAEWGGELELVNVRGMPMVRERVFLHRASRTVIQTDLVFNLDDRGWWTNSYLSLCGIRGKVGTSYLLKAVTKDKAAAAAGVDAVLAWDFDNLVVAHGDCVVGGAKEQLRAGLSWLPLASA